MDPRTEYGDLIKDLARIINEKLDIPLINEENEQKFFEFLLSLVFQFIVSKRLTGSLKK